MNLFPEKCLFLAPMEDVTDLPFRRLCSKMGADVTVTEFVSSEGLIRDAERSRQKMSFCPEEKQAGIQIFGGSIDAMVEAARIAEAEKPAFIDLNFGCPVNAVVSKGGGAALLKDIPKMIAMTSAVVRAVSIPVTAKTRLGWDERDKPILSLAEKLQDAGIAALTIHGRTRSQMYKGNADWTLIGKVRENPAIRIPVIGNGDINHALKAEEYFNRYGVDGIMIGRAATGYPWIFNEVRRYLDSGAIPLPPKLTERIDVAVDLLSDLCAFHGERKGVLIMRKHYSGIFRSIPDFKKHRMELLTLQEPDALIQTLENLKS